jgi:hypothetical protein
MYLVYVDETRPNPPGRADSTPPGLGDMSYWFPKNAAEKAEAERRAPVDKGIADSLKDPGADWGG